MISNNDANLFQFINDLPIIPDLYHELTSLLESGIISWSKHNQICLNTIPDQPHNFGLGGGSLLYDWSNAVTSIQDGIHKIDVPKFDTPLQEEDFTILCSVFKNTKFEQLYNVLADKYKLGRVRFMKLEPKTCLSWHADSNKRLHYPLKTGEGCLMVIEDKVVHLPVNTWCMTNTVLPHTAFNSSKESRIHLVAAIL